ncbi:VOC family protein [Diaphorobacter aerolatus]|uniref:Glyoxalase/fosfomycin resistance/dioxygenase domain-containing protein n=1 Tax=Diaphorobacter aerolatus TaxID=1288495 RepID=A0A7H0GMR4_9BURK|nr:VOC family protein [Diaphorobacter aerolatus]QNP49580.1 hypothetical protein H9K75_06290 [Diaphorobacter aerolatus]
MIDHTGVMVSDFAKSLAFYEQALEPLGYAMLKQLSAAQNRPHRYGRIR